ncbi:amino acid ABC transporter substrate-binding protein [Rossellomorea vietnamensis]|uniref:Amino acid ABC transporter substrate-binding protein n=1 Tax=Rossellomorea vietnamensis TaxID=218284 RepID=A0A5D4MF04_9BACI|nr:amino acid ABC transporter substrate-binding protein [Rossellomorea vietnamensis]TYR99560.1 amino acid ABC transporter substrate-binding protein [Rossellomorea vietnamensis]
MKKLSMSLLFFLGAVFMLAACGNNTENEESSGAGDEKQEQSLYKKIQEDGEFLIGTEGTYPPFTFHDESGELTGFDVEIAREVANRLGVEPVFQETQWDAMFEGLNSNRFDMIANQVGIREDRQEKYDFSIPYIESSAVLVASKDNEEVTSFEDIEGLTSAQSLTSNYRDIAESYGAEIQGVDGLAQAIQLLEQGRVDVTVNDKLSILDYLQKQKNAGVEIVATEEEGAQSGLMFRQGNEELVEEVNKALEEMMEDGTYAEISDKWFGEDVSPR